VVCWTSTAARDALSIVLIPITVRSGGGQPIRLKVLSTTGLMLPTSNDADSICETTRKEL
jgi:hypothetical protein